MSNLKIAAVILYAPLIMICCVVIVHSIYKLYTVFGKAEQKLFLLSILAITLTVAIAIVTAIF